MNKNFKVITINGVRGIFAVIFLVLGLIAGFIISPGWVCMALWNHYVVPTGTVASMNIFQGVLLWTIIALSLYALNNKQSLIGFGSYQGLTPEQIKDIMNRTRMSEEKIKRDLAILSKEIKPDTEILTKQEIQHKTNSEDTENKEEVGSNL